MNRLVCLMNMAKIKSITDEMEQAIIYDYQHSNLKVKEIACKHKTHQTTISKIIAKHNIPRRKNEITEDRKLAVIEQYLADKPLQDICRETHMGLKAVYAILNAAEIPRRKQLFVDRSIRKRSEQLCWSCQNAVGRCSWSKNFTPVKGWTAYIDKRRGNSGEETETWSISACPEFIADE